MHQNWVLDDDAIIGKLKERWFNRDCIEMDILEFEEARQGDYETLAQFMQRVKGLGQRAFSEFDANGMHQRIVWRFLDGVKDKEIRGAIIRERWMKDRLDTTRSGRIGRLPYGWAGSKQGTRHRGG